MRKYDKAQLLACIFVFIAEVVICFSFSVILWAFYTILKWGIS